MARKQKSKIEFRYYTMPKDSPMLVLLGEKWKMKYGDDREILHFHNYTEIGICHMGTGIMKFEDEVISYKGGEFTVIPKNYPHLTKSEDGTISYWEYLFVDIESVIKDMCGINTNKADRMIQKLNAGAIMKNAEENPKIADRILEILDCMRNAEEFYKEEARALLYALIVEIARMIDIKEERILGSEAKMTQAVAQIVEYIGDNYMKPIKIDKLAEDNHFSATHFRRVFTSQINMTPLEYINLVRIQNACEYLRNTDKSIGEIAQLCGFGAISTFNRNFSRMKGMSPGQWRKQPENYEHQLLSYTIISEDGW